MEQIVVKSDDYNSESQVTKDEWLKILSDDNFMTNNYKYALSIFFLEPDHKATCKFLADKYHTSPFSISGFITGFSRAVQERLNRFEITTEEGEKTYWLVTMLGTKVSGKLFEWKLRAELVEAMTELDFINSNSLNVDDLGTLIEYINKDIGKFRRDFAEARKKLTNMRNMPNSKILFKYDDLSRDWSINVGGGTEVQYHINLRGNNIGYGLGFNAQYVPFNNEKTSLEHVKPYVSAFLSMQSNESLELLNARNFSIDLASLKNMKDGDYSLFGRTVEMNNNRLSLINYYSIINDLKGDVFDLYKQIFENANELTMIKQASTSNAQPPIANLLLQEISDLLLTNKNLILTGAPGTGKTYLAKEICKALNATYELVQFHPSYDYTDFVEGLRPVQNKNSEVGFELRDGIFKKFCKEALKADTNYSFDEAYEQFIKSINENGLKLETHSEKKPFRIEVDSQENVNVYIEKNNLLKLILNKRAVKYYFEYPNSDRYSPYTPAICNYIKENFNFKINKDESKKFILILDEINRAEISKVLGELFFSIDPSYRGESGRVTTQYSNLQTSEDVFKDGFYVPENVYIIGTMNDIDRSVESFDFAMRRRFAWREIKAKDRLSMWDGEIDEWIEEAKARLNSLNGSIESIQGLNSAYHVGPAYFLKLTNYDGDFEALWMHHLQSLLFEYLRGYPDSEQQLEQLKNAYDMVDYDASND